MLHLEKSKKKREKINIKIEQKIGIFFILGNEIFKIFSNNVCQKTFDNQVSSLLIVFLTTVQPILGVS